MELRNVAAMIHRHATFRIQPVWLNRTIPDMSFRANAVSRGILPSSKFYLVLVLPPTWWIPPLRFATVGMTYWRVIPFCPHRLYSERGGRQIAAPTYTLGRSTVHSYGLYSFRCLAMNHRRYIACTIYCVVPFTRTGCIRNVAGGRLPPLHARW